MRRTRFYCGPFQDSPLLPAPPPQTIIPSSSSSHTPSSYQQIPLPKTFFFKSQHDQQLTKGISSHLQFEQTINNLCNQSNLTQAINTLEFVKRPSGSIYIKLIHLCIQLRSLEDAKRVYSHAKSSGFTLGVPLAICLIDFYCKCGSLVEARKVFYEMPDRNLSTWNLIIVSYARMGRLFEARNLFDLMPERDRFLGNYIVSCYVQHDRLSEGRELFDRMKEKDSCSWNIMVNGYAKKGMLDEARRLFDQIPEKDNFSWTAIISGYVKGNQPVEAIDLYRTMQKRCQFKGNQFTATSALGASAAIPCLHLGKEIHGHILRVGLDLHAVILNALSDMYGKGGSLDEARKIFNGRVDKDIVSWNAMIDRYFDGGRRQDGFLLFSDLLRSGIRPNEFTFARILNACAQQCTQDMGTQVHGYMTRIGFSPCSFAASALVNIYCKCGDTEVASRVFGWIKNPDLFSWTALINGYAQNGQPLKALKLFESLQESGFEPDQVTFVGVLSACTHAGLVDKGLEYFNSIKEKHGLAHTTEHYACLVDLLCRTGRLSEAEDLISKMAIKPNKFIWASLLGGCKVHKNLELAKRAVEALFKIEPENPATYVTLANMYAAAGKWDEVAKVRETMDKKGVVKHPGLSWTEIKRKVSVFKVGDISNPRYKEIQELWMELLKRMKEQGYVPESEAVLHDVEEEQREQSLSLHSEKLAVAFAIIGTPPGTSIKVFKNLRICVDCHAAFKLISKIVDRKITVRDSSRFHCFESGSCSCKDFW